MYLGGGGNEINTPHIILLFRIIRVIARAKKQNIFMYIENCTVRLGHAKKKENTYIYVCM